MGSLGCTSKERATLWERGRESLVCVDFGLSGWVGGVGVDRCSTTKKKGGVLRARPLRHIHSLVVDGVLPIRTHPSLPPSLILAWG